MLKVPPGIQIIFGGADDADRSSDATTLSFTCASSYKYSEQSALSLPEHDFRQSYLPGL